MPSALLKGQQHSDYHTVPRPEGGRRPSIVHWLSVEDKGLFHEWVSGVQENTYTLEKDSVVLAKTMEGFKPKGWGSSYSVSDLKPSNPVAFVITVEDGTWVVNFPSWVWFHLHQNSV